MFPFPEPSLVLIYIQWLRKTFCSLELRVQFCLLVCGTYPSLSTVNKEKNLTDQRASFRVDTRETQHVPYSKEILVETFNDGEAAVLDSSPVMLHCLTLSHEYMHKVALVSKEILEETFNDGETAVTTTSDGEL